MANPHRLSSIAQAREELLALRAAKVVRTERGMTLHQALVHLSQSFEYPLSGFPRMQPALMRATVGFVASRVFLLRGQMSHDLTAQVLEAPVPQAEGDLAAAWDRLLLAMDRVMQHQGPLHPHFVFGALKRDQYERILTIHLADHLSVFAA